MQQNQKKIMQIILDSEKENDFHSSQLSLVGKVLLARLENNLDKVSTKELHDYLIKVETWTHYELMLFNNIMFTFDDDFLLLILRKAPFRLDKYKLIKNYGSEVFCMYANALIIFFESNQPSSIN